MATKRKKAAMPQGKKRSVRAGRFPVSDAHNIDIVNTAANWLRWGQLVLFWIENPDERPENVRDLRRAMAMVLPLPVQGTVWAGDPDDPDRPVRIEDYPGTGPIIIPLPTLDMIARDKRILDRILTAGGGVGKYPLPRFYNAAYANPERADLNQAQMYDMALRRLGEYVINECM